MLDIGIIGTGAIGSNLCEELQNGAIPDARVTAVYNRTPERAESLVESLEAESEIQVASNPLAVSERADIVVEAASQRAVERSAVDVLSAGANLFVLSVGAFRNERLLRRVRQASEDNGARVHVPSGSIAGLDGIAAVATGSLEELTLTHYRPPAYLEPYLDTATSPDELRDGDVVFEGTAADAAESFPSHMNIAMALTLAAKTSPDNVSIRIVTDVDAPRSRNVIRARSAVGAIEIEIDNFRSSTHETSSLIVGSILETLRRMSDHVIVGT